MKEGLLKKTACLTLALLVLAWLLPCAVLPVQAADSDLSAMLEEQIRAYADTIDQPTSDEKAAWLLAKHGIMEQGKTLVADDSHPLTALLMNAELTQAALADLLAAMVSAVPEFDAEPVYAVGSCTWDAETYGYGYQLYREEPSEEADPFDSVSCEEYTGPTNGYDVMLKWVTAATAMEISLQQAEIREKTIAYDVRVTFSDHFVFDANTNTGSISMDLLALLGSALFKEFDWESTATFQLEVPHPCAHAVANYHWTYDGQQKTLISDTSEDYTENEAQQILQEGALQNSYHHKLEQDVTLRHNDPWVVEYSVKDPNMFVFSPAATKDTDQPYFLNYNRLYLFFACNSADGTGTDYYGTSLIGSFRYNTYNTFRIRLENVVAEDGSNMVYVTIYNEDLETVVLESTAMDDRYVIENGFWVNKESESAGLSGMDFTIRYIGNESYRFDPAAFDFSIWTKGQDVEGQTYFTAEVTAPTCADQGFTTHSCGQCGYSYVDSWVDPTGHSWGAWEIVKEATETESGLQQHTCATCGETEQEVIPWLSVLYGDVNCDDRINSLDLILLRQHLAGWDVEVDLAAADVNGNGTVNSLDLILLRQHLAGWDVTLGP